MSQRLKRESHNCVRSAIFNDRRQPCRCHQQRAQLDPAGAGVRFEYRASVHWGAPPVMAVAVVPNPPERKGPFTRRSAAKRSSGARRCDSALGPRCQRTQVGEGVGRRHTIRHKCVGRLPP
jgi:hypothetical protein